MVNMVVRCQLDQLPTTTNDQHLRGQLPLQAVQEVGEKTQPECAVQDHGKRAKEGPSLSSVLLLLVYGLDSLSRRTL